MKVCCDCSTLIRPNRWTRLCRKYCTAPRLQTPGNPGAIGDFITQLGQAPLNKWIGYERGKSESKRKPAKHGQEWARQKERTTQFIYLSPTAWTARALCHKLDIYFSCFNLCTPWFSLTTKSGCPDVQQREGKKGRAAGSKRSRGWVWTDFSRWRRCSSTDLGETPEKTQFGWNSLHWLF